MKTKLLIFSLLAVCLFGQAVSPITFNKTVTTAGTPVRLTTTNIFAISATIQALHSNTGRVCFGDSNVLVSTNRGTCLAVDLAAPLLEIGQPGGKPFDLSTFWLDSSVSGEGVSVTYYLSQ